MTTALLSQVGGDEVVSGETLRAMPLSPEEVGARIARGREEKKWSQFDLALAMSVSPSTIYRWEKGKLPSVNELMRLAEVLDKPFNYLAEPPEHQAQLSDLQHSLENVPARLEAIERSVAALEHELERGREIFVGTLEQVRDALVALDRRLPTEDEPDSAGAVQ